MKARNEYLLTVEASNAATKKYFEEDLSLIVDVSWPMNEYCLSKKSFYFLFLAIMVG